MHHSYLPSPYPAPPTIHTLSLQRRSSDLTVSPDATASPSFLTQRLMVPVSMVGESFAMRTSIAMIFLLNRSEEHTSELQSRRDLVCRLLLEKKKSADLSSPNNTTYILTSP